MQEELTDMKTDIALIKSDIKQINKFFTKVESTIDMMTELSTQVAVQQEVIKNTVDKLEDLDKMVQDHREEDIARAEKMMARLEEYRSSAYNDHLRLSQENKSNRDQRHKEMMEEIRSVTRKIDEQNKRIRSLENWKYYMMGLGAAVVFIIVKVINVGAFFS